jgi:hypothetical protein
MYPWSVKADRFSAEVIGAAMRARRVMGPDCLPGANQLGTEENKGNEERRSRPTTAGTREAKKV